MASRNRTIIFRRYRDALKSVRVPAISSPASSSTTSGGGPVIELVNTSLINPNRSYAPLSTEDPGNSSKGALTVGLPPAWVDVSEEIATNVQRARTRMAELAKAHAKALMPSFGDGKEDQRLIESLSQEITGLIKRSEKKLQRLSAAGPSEDSNVRKNVQRSLATDLQNLSMELRKKQSTYLKRLRQQKEGQDGVDLEMNLNGNRSKMEDDDLDNMVFNEHQMAKLKKSEAFTAEREREIQQVVESVNELAQIMKDLSVLVIDQGTIVDRIDYNIQNVATNVEEGLKQLQKAERTQKHGGMVRFCFHSYSDPPLRLMTRSDMVMLYTCEDVIWVLNGPSIPDIETTYLVVLFHFPGFWGGKSRVGWIGFCSGSAQEMYRAVVENFCSFEKGVGEWTSY